MRVRASPLNLLWGGGNAPVCARPRCYLSRERACEIFYFPTWAIYLSQVFYHPFLFPRGLGSFSYRSSQLFSPICQVFTLGQGQLVEDLLETYSYIPSTSGKEYGRRGTECPYKIPWVGGDPELNKVLMLKSSSGIYNKATPYNPPHHS